MGAVAIEPGRTPRPLFERPVGLSAGDGRIAWNAKGDMAASVIEDFTHAPAIYAGRATALRQITHDNDGVQPAVQARSVTWTNEGFTVQGWLLSPLNANPDGKAPMIVQVHGGPSAASTPRFIERGWPARSRMRAIIDSCPIRVAPMGRARRSLRPTSATSAAATCAIFWRGSMRSKSWCRSTMRGWA